MFSNNLNEPDQLNDKFENIYVYHDHIYPRQYIGETDSFILAKYQERSVVLDRGINIKFGEQLRECMLRIPVLLSPDVLNNVTSPTMYSKIFLTTYNTGIHPLEKNEKISVIPPMCDCHPKFKINGVIPLQTVSNIKFTAALNQFLNWIRGVNLLKLKLEEHMSIFPKLLSIAYEQIKSNYLVQDMMNHIRVHDGSGISKIETLYDIVYNHWLEPLLGSNGIISDGMDIQKTIESTLRVLNDTNPDFIVLFQFLDSQASVHEELQNEIDEKLKELIINILNIPQYYEMLTRYMCPLKLPVVGIVSTSFEDLYHIYSKHKMIVKKL